MLRKYFIKSTAAQIRAAKTNKEIDAIVASMSDIWDDKIPGKIAPVIVGAKRGLEVRAHFRTVKGSKSFAGFTTTCEGYCCEDCSNNDANTPGSFCAGSNCGWCHGAMTVWVDGVPYGQGGCDYNDAQEEEEKEEEEKEEGENLPPEEGFEEIAEE